MIRHLLLLVPTACLLAGAPSSTEPMDANVALKELMAGNKRYSSGHYGHPHQNVSRRREISRGQHPFAVILGCADSRVPPELIFDQGLGDLFVVRVAGNVPDDVIMGSLEYAVEHLGAHLIMVLGHQRCGAVEAAVAGGEAHGHVHNILDLIKPAVDEARHEQGDLLDNAILDNVKRVVAQLKDSQPVLSELVKKGKVKVVGARYNLDSGSVTLVP